MALKFSANLSMLYADVPFMQRFQLAALAGFSAVEFMFPYEYRIKALREELERGGLQLVLFNLPAGDTGQGEWGMLSNPHRRDDFRRGFDQALEAAFQLNCGLLNTMYGNRVEGVYAQDQLDTACENLLWAAPQASQAGVTLTIEPLNPVDFPHYALIGTYPAVEVLRRVNHPRVRLQYDVYHSQMAEGNLINTIRATFPHIAHIQIADVPGRHQPGTGEINYPAVFAALEDLGYPGYTGLEYRPEGDTDISLAWLPFSARRAGEQPA